VAAAHRVRGRSAAEGAGGLRALFAATGARAGSPVVAYCTSGIMSSLSYFVARYLGYDAMLYDGSWFDWSPNTELPVAQCPTPWC
jgi:3-mercaptopyruvate sulfurtransferase SseA